MTDIIALLINHHKNISGVFSDANSLLANIEKTDFALVFIGLHVGGESGYAIADRIRNTGLDVEIAFLSDNSGQMRLAFQYRPIGFIEKPASTECVLELMNAFMMHLLRSDVLYIESCGRNVCINLVNGERVMHHARLREYEESMSNFGFARIHRGIIANLMHVSSISKTDSSLKMSNGTYLPISSSKYPYVVEKYTKHCGSQI